MVKRYKVAVVDRIYRNEIWDFGDFDSLYKARKTKKWVEENGYVGEGEKAEVLRNY